MSLVKHNKLTEVNALTQDERVEYVIGLLFNLQMCQQPPTGDAMCVFPSILP